LYGHGNNTVFPYKNKDGDAFSNLSDIICSNDAASKRFNQSFDIALISDQFSHSTRSYAIAAKKIKI
jgi:hypothetical protein